MTKLRLDRFAWLVVLGVTLGISGYSLYYVGRHLGVPKIFAVPISTAYDGTALLAANYSLKYAQAGASGTAPNLAVLAFAALSAWLNSLHSILGHENPLAIALWAPLPVAAVVIFEIHTSFERRRALAKMGVAYPAPIPKFGGWRWFLFPVNTLTELRAIVAARSKALYNANMNFALPNVVTRPVLKPEPKPVSKPLNPAPALSPKPDLTEPVTGDGADVTEPLSEPLSEPEPEPVVTRPAPVRRAKPMVSPNSNISYLDPNRPKPADVRAWAQATGWVKPVDGQPLGDRARIPDQCWIDYAAAMADEEQNEEAEG